MSQSHFTLAFPLKAQADSQAPAEHLSSLMPALFQAADRTGSLPYSWSAYLYSKVTTLF
jgi:hypothetical protein